MKAQTLLKSKGWSGWVRFTINATESSERVKCDGLLVSLAFTGWTISPGRVGHDKYWLAMCRTNCVDRKYLAEWRPGQTHEKWEDWVDVEIVQRENSMCAPCAEHFPWLCPTRLRKLSHTLRKQSRCAFAQAATASSLLEHLCWNKVIGICAENCQSNRHRRCNYQCVQAPLVLPTDIPGLWSPPSMPLHTGVNYYLYCFCKWLSIIQLFLKEAATTQQVTLDVEQGSGGCYWERLRVSGPYPALPSAGSQELWSLGAMRSIRGVQLVLWLVLCALTP